MNMQWHHMIPVELGGSEDETNFVLLSTKDHAAAHMALFQRYGHPKDLARHRQLVAQAQAESNGHVSRPHQADAQADALDGAMDGQALKSQKYPRYGKGVAMSEAHKAKISASTRGKYVSDETKAKIAEGMKGNSNSKKHSSDEYKHKQSATMKESWVRRKARMEAIWDAQDAAAAAANTGAAD